MRIGLLGFGSMGKTHAYCVHNLKYFYDIDALSKIGADKVVLPEYESGVRLAKNLLSSGFVDILELTNNVSLVEIDIKPEWVGKSLVELNLRKKYSINVIAIQQGNNVSTEIDPHQMLEQTMRLIVVANRQKLDKMR